MSNQLLVTAKIDGVYRTLTISQWSDLLDVPKKTLYARRKKGRSDNAFLNGFYSEKQSQVEKDEQATYLDQCYTEFNYSHGIINLWRQKNGIR